MANYDAQIDAFEARKGKLNSILTRSVDKVMTSQPNNIVTRTCLQRLLRQVPEIYDPYGKSDLVAPFTLVRDPHWPSFENFLYGSLDF